MRIGRLKDDVGRWMELSRACLLADSHHSLMWAGWGLRLAGLQYVVLRAREEKKKGGEKHFLLDSLGYRLRT